MKKTSVFAVSLYFLLFFTSPVYAYLDPGSGSMILQLLLGGLAGAAVFLKFYWRKLFGFFGFGKGKESDSEQDISDSDK